MTTTTFTSDKPSRDAVEACVGALHKGGVVVYPTDTLYGLGADVTNSTAVKKIQTIKKREANKPILAMVEDLKMLEAYAEVTPLAKTLAEMFLPGPLTLVLSTKDKQLAAVAAADGSVGFRIPDNVFCLDMVRSFGKPITSTSVNVAGETQPNTVSRMLEQLGAQAKNIDVVIDNGELSVSPPSTIVDARGDHLVVLREGAISRDTLKNIS